MRRFDGWREAGVVVTLLLSPVGFARASGNGRTGFMFGFGLGPEQHMVHEPGAKASTVTYRDSIADTIRTFTRPASSPRWNTEAGWSLQLQLGYAFSRRTQLHLTRLDVLRFNSSSYSSSSSTTLRRVHSILVIGLDHRPGRDAGPWFLSGGLGLSTVAEGDGRGLGLMAGGGRDLGRIAQTRLTFSYARAPDWSGSLRHRLAAALLFDFLWR